MTDTNRYYVKDEEENKAINLANGMFNFKIDSKEYKEFKEKLISGELSTERFNDPIPVNPENYTVFERFLLYNFQGYNYNFNDINKIKEIIHEANDLLNYGIEKKTLVFDLDYLNSWFNLSQSKIDPEVKKGENIHLPLNANERKQIEEVEQLWKNLLSGGAYPEKTADRSHLQVKRAKLS